jgi:saccharopine dehydrogenase (NAD+, L-lysine-forming)
VTLVPEASWIDAPHDNTVVGLKELPDDKFALKHAHVQLAHCYKGQGGWQDVLARSPRGGGTLLDLELLTDDDSGHRVAASAIVLATLALPLLWRHGPGS